MTDLAHLKFYATQPHPCSYLEKEHAVTLFLDPYEKVDEHTYERLSELGFRRSGDHLYRPHCPQCKACVPARIPVDTFTPSRQQLRIWRRNRDLLVTRCPPRIDSEIYELYSRYINIRHADGDMYPPSREQFESFLVSNSPFCEFNEFRLDGRLLAVAVTDRLANGLSAIYTFFDPEESRRSLGRYAILWQIDEARRAGLPAVYLGYWIRNCRKMNYKTEYRPLEMLVSQRWILVH